MLQERRCLFVVNDPICVPLQVVLRFGHDLTQLWDSATTGVCTIMRKDSGALGRCHGTLRDTKSECCFILRRSGLVHT